ncbi:S-protein secretion component D [Fimbriimonas ginsengisoli Gsoil 348]|uniref:S-protein secretion component D n=1 Tax=Fimbriimonas ginsengisoli Gsoil 348 TaxID=661478 RepID=A0A068NSM8_FIMGI|nr:S-protein secretion component D [Fimbriimonas ginsengisoli Gsoil 348]
MSWAKMALLTVLTGVVVAPLTAAVAQQTSNEGVRLDLTLKDADMMQATNMLFVRAGISFVVEPSSEPYKKITLKIDNVTAEEAVGYICQAAGAYFRRDENGVYIISQRKPAVVGPTAPAAPTKKPMLLRRVKLLRADAQQVYDMVMFRIPFDSNRGFEALKKFTNFNQQDASRIYGPNANVQAQGLGQTFGPVQAQNPTRNSNALSAAESGSEIPLPGEEAANQIGGGRGGGAGGFGGQGGGGGLGGGGGQGGIGGGGGQGNANLTGGQGLVPEGIDFISYDPTDNSLVVRGDEDAINTLQGYITLFDVAPRQVQIKVEFITTTQTVDRSFGTEFLYQRGSIITGTRPGSFVRTGDPIFLNYAVGDVTARLRTSLTEGNGKVVSAPILRTLNNQPASITSSISTTIFINNTVVSNGAVVTTSNPIPLTATTLLAVAPRINDDNTITVYLSPQIQNFVGSSRGPNGEQIPNTVVQAISVVARVRNNETIVLGGLTQKNEDNGSTRVPVLSELPIIGQFFRFGTKTKTNSELLIFVTPSIVDDETQNAGGP